MLYIIILTILALTIFGRVCIKDKLSRAIVFMYLVWWGLWLGLSTFNFYNLYSVSSSTYYLLLLNVIMFCLGYCICGVLRDKNNANVKSINVMVSKQKGFVTILIVVLLILLYYWLRYRNVVNSMSSSNIRMERFSVGNVFSSSFEIMLFNYFVESFIYAVIVVLAYMVVFGEIKNSTFILTSLSVFFYAGIGSGRAPIMNLLISIALIFFIRLIDSGRQIHVNTFIKRKRKIKKIKIRNIIFIMIVALIVIAYSAWLTSSRLGYTELNKETLQTGWNEFFKQGCIYYTGPFRALDYGLQVYPDQIGHLLGRGTFAGIDDIFSSALRIMGFNITSVNSVIGQLLQYNTIQIGYDQPFNFAYTSVMIHYFDAGILGVVIFPFIYGFFVRKAAFLYEKNPMLPTLIIVVFLFNTMINSVFSWGLQSASSNIVLIGCYIWYKSIRKKEKQLEI